MSYCIFFQKEDDVHEMKVYNSCDIENGNPCVPCTEYMEIEAQIEKTRQILEEQLGRRREIREKINRLHDPMLRRVPREITTYIFELAASVDAPTEGAESEDALREGELYAPLPLGSVSGAWRGIAWDMPQLWSFMPARIRTVEQIPSRLEVAKQWLERTGDYLLSIYFRINETYYEEDCEEWNKFIPFIDLLARYSYRWTDLCGLCPPPLIRHLTSMATSAHGVPQLQYLQLSSPYRAEIKDIFSRGDGHIPQPRSLRLDNIPIHLDIGVDWGHVTQLRLDTFSTSVFLALLPLLQNLQDLGIYGMFADWEDNKPNVIHYKVETLYVECLHKHRIIEVLCDFLAYLAFPSLQNLTVNLLCDHDLLQATTNFCQQSSCNLSSLSLSDYPSVDSILSTMNFLRHLNSLQNLEIVVTSTDNGQSNFLQALLDTLQQHRGSGSQLCPLADLQRFTYIDKSQAEIPWDILLDIFDRDWCVNRPSWRTLSVIFPLEAHTAGVYPPYPRGLNEKMMDRVLILVEAGIEVILPGGLREAIQRREPVMMNQLDED